MLRAGRPRTTGRLEIREQPLGRPDGAGRREVRPVERARAPGRRPASGTAVRPGTPGRARSTTVTSSGMARRELHEQVVEVSEALVLGRLRALAGAGGTWPRRVGACVAMTTPGAVVGSAAAAPCPCAGSSPAPTPACRNGSVRPSTSMSARSQVESQSTTSGRWRERGSQRGLGRGPGHASRSWRRERVARCDPAARDPARDHRGLVDPQPGCAAPPPRARAAGCTRSSHRRAAPGPTARADPFGPALLRTPGAPRCAARVSSGRGWEHGTGIGAERRSRSAASWRRPSRSAA